MTHYSPTLWIHKANRFCLEHYGISAVELIGGGDIDDARITDAIEAGEKPESVVTEYAEKYDLILIQ